MRGAAWKLDRFGAGVFVKRGAAKPDISSVEAFKRAFLNAKSIALVDPAAGGPWLFMRLAYLNDSGSVHRRPRPRISTCRRAESQDDRFWHECDIGTCLLLLPLLGVKQKTFTGHDRS